MEQENITQTEKRSSNRWMLVLLVLMALLSAWLFWKNNQLADQVVKLQETEEKAAGLEKEKEELSNFLEEMLQQYDTLKTENSQLQAEMAGQAEQIKELLKQVEKHKDDAWLIRKYKKEANTLREIMKGYVHTIDSLNTLNLNLQAENMDIKEELGTVKSEKRQLQDKTQNLENLVAIGSVLQTANLASSAILVRSGGKQVETKRASRAEMIKTCFSLGENKIAESGPKDLYLRIISPEGKVLETEGVTDNHFEFDGVKGNYSVKREVQYNNSAMDVCIFFPISSEIPKGDYIVDIYEEGANIGQTKFTLK